VYRQRSVYFLSNKKSNYRAISNLQRAQATLPTCLDINVVMPIKPAIKFEMTDAIWLVDNSQKAIILLQTNQQSKVMGMAHPSYASPLLNVCCRSKI